jgi:septum site-determining protein MinD
MTKTFGIIAIKGGVGKTSAVAALGATLANDFNKKVLLVDGNFTAPNLALSIGFINPEITIHHVLDGKAQIKQAIYETGYGFDVVPGSLNYPMVNPLKLRDRLSEIKRKYDVIIIDSSPNLNDEILATMTASDELIVVTTPDVVTLGTTLRAINLAKQRKTPISGLILNKVYNKKFEIPLEQIEDACDTHVLAVLPHDVKIMEALSQSLPSTMHKKTKSLEEYRKLAASMIGEDYKKNNWLGDRLKMFMKKVPKQDVNRVIFKVNRSK